jgi:hypothetical protein
MTQGKPRGLYADLRDRGTHRVDRLLTTYLRPDAVAICDDAGQVRGGAHCCRSTYLVINSIPLLPARSAPKLTSISTLSVITASEQTGQTAS